MRLLKSFVQVNPSCFSKLAPFWGCLPTLFSGWLLIGIVYQLLVDRCLGGFSSFPKVKDTIPRGILPKGTRCLKNLVLCLVILSMSSGSDRERDDG